MVRHPWIMRSAVILLTAGAGLFLLNYLAPLQWPTLLVYSGLLAVVAGAVFVLLPPAWLGITRRWQAMLIVAAGAVLAVAGLLWPARVFSTPARLTRPDAFLPEYHFHEHHELRVHASEQRVREAFAQITFDDRTFMRTLGTIRSPWDTFGPAPPVRNQKCRI